jgi:hypothetical protein
MCETIFFFSVQLCVNPWTGLRQADLQRYLFWGGKGMFLCFYVQKIVPVDTLLIPVVQICKIEDVCKYVVAYKLTLSFEPAEMFQFFLSI